MELPRRQFLHLAGGATMLATLPRATYAQAFPSHPITMVVPVPAGGAMDTVARIVAGGMQAALGQPVVIENVTGASGSIGVGRVARATPDGYMIIYGALVTHVVNAAVYQLPYDVLADFGASSRPRISRGSDSRCKATWMMWRAVRGSCASTARLLAGWPPPRGGAQPGLRRLVGRQDGPDF